jgi:O-succinylbenzoic acid--CoA ligase
MTDPLRRYATARPDAPALWTPHRRWTYADLDAAVAATQARLDEVGVEGGKRVALYLDRRPAVVVLLWALWRAGAVAVPLSTRLPAADVPDRARRVGAHGLISDDSAVARAAPADLTVRSPELVARDGEARGGRSPGPTAWSRHRPATIVFTSGSTGTPKAALHTWANHLYSAKGSNANLPLRRGDRWLLSLPLYHVGGLAILVRCALAGAAVAVPDPKASIADQLTTAHATHVSLVATQFRRLLDATQGTPPSFVRAVLLGGGPIPGALLRRGHQRGWPLHTSYGSTEMASQVTTTAPGAPLDELQTAGRRLPHRRVRIEAGEIQVRGAPLFRGYVTADGLDDPRTDDGWYPTGDRGRLDAGGRLHVLGRMDRMFVSGGENVQPEEIETALERLDGIERAIVVPVPDAEYGERPVAFVQAGDSWDPPAFKQVLTSELPGFKIPDAFHSLPQDARSGSLKIDRKRLQKQARKLQEDTVPNENSR